jgi:hypothetical protein
MSFRPDTKVLICRIVGHRRSRRVWHEGDGYRAQCKRCGTGMVRLRGASNWTALPFESD